MKKRLLVCSNVYILTMMVLLRNQLFDKEDQIDIILTDYIPGYKELARSLSSEQVFSNVYTDEAQYVKHDIYNKGIRKVVKEFRPEKYVGFLWTTKYDALYIHNLNNYCDLLFASFCKRFKSIPELILVEDGAITCSVIYETFLKSVKSRRSSFLSFCLKRKHIDQYISYSLAADKELYCWNPPFDIVQIAPPIIEEKMVKKLNNVFSFKGRNINNKIVYIETISDSRYNVDEVKLVEEIAGKIGKQNVVIKTHPRNKNNRFKAAGYTVLEEYNNTPFELMLLNNLFRNCIFMTLSSNALCNVGLIFRKRLPIISVIHCANVTTEFLRNGIQPVIEKVYEKYGEFMKMPYSIKEVINEIDKIGLV